MLSKQFSSLTVDIGMAEKRKKLVTSRSSVEFREIHLLEER